MSSVVKGTIILFLFFSFCTKAQNDEESIEIFSKILPGAIILNNGERISSAFTLSPEGLLTTYTPSGYSAEGYTPKDVRSFSFFDSTLHSTRFFYSMPFKIGDPTFHFFELIHQTDRISILSRFELEDEGTGAASKFVSTMVLLRYGYGGVRKKFKDPKTYKAVYKRYLLDHRHDIIYELSKTSLLELINDSAETLDYVKKQNYNLNEMQISECIEVVDFYSNSQKPLAK